MDKKYTVAVLLRSLLDDYQENLWQGLLEGAKRNNIRLVTLMGGDIKSSSGFNSADNAVFSFTSKNYFDGIIIPSTVILSSLGSNEQTLFFKQFGNKPILSIGVKIEGIKSLLVDNFKGLYDLVEHLIYSHGYSKIAYVGGPVHNEEAKIRYNAYVTALKDNNIEINDDYVFYGNFMAESGISAMQVFLDERKITPDVVVCANDNMAFGVVRELEFKKIKVPGEIAVTGFDNIRNAKVLTPSLTTVMQPVYENGIKAMNLMHTMLTGGELTNEVEVMATSVVVRQSCGCIVKQDSTSKQQSTESLKCNEDFADLILDESQVKTLYNALKSDIDNNTNDNFITIFNNFLQKKYDDYYQFYTVISRLSCMLKDDINSDKDSITKTDNKRKLFFKRKIVSAKIDNHLDKYYYGEKLLHDAGQLITKKIEQTAIKFQLASEKESLLQNEISSNITSISQDLFQAIESEFPIIGITDCYISFFSDDKKNVTLKMSIQPQNDVNTQYDGILPDHIWNSKLNDNMIIFPLFFDDELFGYIVYILSKCSSLVYEILTKAVSNAIKLLDDYEKQRKQSTDIQALIWPMLNLIKEIIGRGLNKTDNVNLVNNADTDYNDTIIGKTSNRINEMLNFIGTINSIAKGINLLAINSSIQASQAGEYSKVFKVISGEIRKLSDTTAENAVEIENILNDVSELMTSLIEKMNKLSDNSNQILHYMEDSD